MYIGIRTIKQWGLAVKINNFSFNHKPQVILLCLLGFFFVGCDVVAMNLQKHKDIIFVYEKDTSHVLPVTKDVYMLSGYIKSLLFGAGELGLEQAERKIPLDFAFPDIKKSFDLMEMYARHKKEREGEDGLARKALEKFIKKYEFHDLIGVVNCIDYLMCPAVIKKVCLRQIKELADKSDKNIFSDSYFGASLAQLSSPLQESLFLQPAIRNLKNLIINFCKDRAVLLQKNKGISSYFKAEVYNFEGSSALTVWSPDETKVCTSAHVQDSNEIVLWDIANQNNITHQLISQADTTSIAFSPDNNKVAVCNNTDSTIDLWHTYFKRFFGSFINHQSTVSQCVFNQDSTKLFCTTMEPNVISSFMVRDLASGTSKVIDHDFHYLGLPIMSHDGAIVAIVAFEDPNFFVALFNVTDLNNITLLKKIPVPGSIKAIAFSPNDKKIACTIVGDHYVTWLLDISNLDNVSYQCLKMPASSYPGFFETVAFTPDGENILVAGESDKNNPILGFWDISGDLDECTFHNLGFGRAVSVAPSFSQGCRIAYFDNLPIIQTLWTPEEIIAFNELKECDVDQIRLVYALSLRLINHLQNESELQEKRLRECTNQLGQVYVTCRDAMMSSKKEIELDEYELSVFEGLPQNLRQVLERVLSIKKNSKKREW